MSFRRSFAVAVLASAVSLPALAAETPAPTPEVAPVVETPAAASPAPVPARTRQRSALAVAITAALEAEKTAMSALEQRLAGAKDPATVAEIHAQMEQLKRDGEIQLLTLQAVHHRGAGRTAIAEQLEAAVRDLKAPARAFTPIPRSAPSGRTE